MFCVGCGKEIDEGSIFCTHCGSKQTIEEPAPLVSPEQESTIPISEEFKTQGNSKPIETTSSASQKSNSSIIVVGVIAIAIIVALFLLFGKSGGYKSYKDLINDYYNAIYKEDFNALLKCYDKEDQKEMKEDKEDFKDDLEKIKENFDDNYDKNWNKKIDIKSKTKADSDDDVTIYSIVVVIDETGSEYLAVKKYKNKYYIDSDNDSF